MTERKSAEDRELTEVNNMESCEKKPLVKDLNEHIVCPLCRGYLVDATTLTECLHSFCRGCIVRRLSSGARLCPVCNESASPPLLPDARLQRLVYLVVPGLYRSELERRRHFRLVNPQCPPLPQPFGALELTLDDLVSLSLRELTDTNNEMTRSSKMCLEDNNKEIREPTTRYMKCSAAVTVRHLIRLLTSKRGWEETNSGVNVANRIEMSCEDYNGNGDHRKPSVLELSWTLLDLACIFGWKQEAPLKLFYRIVRKDETTTTASTSKSNPCNEDTNKDNPTMENIQRPPTPPPSPKPVQENEVESRRTFNTGTETVPHRALESSKERDKETKSKKPRCEVTPVMRAPDPVGISSSVTMQQNNNNHASESSRTKELARLEHRKRRKRRNKRVIAEITTTPREDLLKLKVRLTPCPPRITSSSSGGQAKEKLLQMRAVRREKIKASCALSQQRSVNLSRDENTSKEIPMESEETIEDIIDCIPDEVVRVAQNISIPQNSHDEKKSHEKKDNQKSSPKVSIRQKDDTPKLSIEEAKGTTTTTTTTTLTTLTTTTTTTTSTAIVAATATTIPMERPKKDEEILRRLGLVAINEANESLRDKSKQRGQNYNDKPNDLDREKLEKQLRESKANRVRSLLAEKQMRDALKGIMSTKTKEEINTITITTTSSTTKTKTKTTTNTTTTSTNTTISSTVNEEGNNKLIKTPIKILKNSDGNYEVLRGTPTHYHSREQNSNSCDVKSSTSPEFSVVDREPSSAGLLFQHLQKDKDKLQTMEKQEKHKRKVTFVDKPTTVKSMFNMSKTIIKKAAEQNDRKKQFLQGFQLAAKEPAIDNLLLDKTSKMNNANNASGVVVSETNSNVSKKEHNNVKNNNGLDKNDGIIDKTNNMENGKVGYGNSMNDNKKSINNTIISVFPNVKSNNVNNKSFADSETRVIGLNANRNVNVNNINNSSKIDVYTFPNDPPPPVVPVGAVKRKCPPGLPISEVKRKRQQTSPTSQSAKKLANVSTQQNLPKTSRKCANDQLQLQLQQQQQQQQMISPKKPMNVINDSGPSRAINVTSPKTSPQSNQLFSNDTRNLLDGCGLNIPASLSITLTAPKSPGNNGNMNDINDTKDNRKNVLGKVNPSITLNDRCVNPCELKALKTGQMRMPVAPPPKARQTKQQMDRDNNHQQRQTNSNNKRKREQEPRDILDLSGGKKMDIHPLRIPQPVKKHKAKSPIRENIPGMIDQGQVVTLMSGHKYYRASPGSLTPAAHRVNDCPLPTPGRTPVYASTGLSSSINGNRTNSNLTAAFPSLKSIFALSQSPSLQQFQMDAMFRLPRAGVGNSGGVSVVGGIRDNTIPNNYLTNNITNSESASVGGGNISGKSHLAAQCAPVKPARSSVAPLAVPISKHQSNERTVSNCLNRNDTNKNVTLRNNDNSSINTGDLSERLSVQPRYSPAPENTDKFSGRKDNGKSGNNDDKTTTSPTIPTDLSLESIPDNSNERNNSPSQQQQQQHQPQQQQQQQYNREAASPRVSSTASPSPPPSESNSNVCNDENRNRQHEEESSVNRPDDNNRNTDLSVAVSKNTSNTETWNSKSPVSPDSSSVAAESNHLSKNNPNNSDQLQTPSSNQETERNLKVTDSPTTKLESNEKSSTVDLDNSKISGKLLDNKQMTSEMLQKKFLAVFPSNEWANNPIAAEHLGNFLKSLNESIKTENNTTADQTNADKKKTTNESDNKDCATNKVTYATNNEVSSNQQKEIQSERSS
ncbi:PREDICTED: probable WRKY transcription factor protein 1 [Polistes dominula]|uniref:Probable WRKY transcription factor protein 1 n=1 Tax=Polistes dominula TaxID=743375 RepID=A0ABM1ILP2_POLDO|nr:PREDICTED: probable WRKY transcription factor protein 1 [Polistes dominula]